MSECTKLLSLFLTLLNLALLHCIQSEYSSIEKHLVIIVDSGCLVKGILQKRASKFCEALNFGSLLLLNISV